jgi:hypothetical protein
MRFLRLASVLWTVIALALPAAAADPLAQAKQLFATYVERLNAFDPAIADLYADDAKIENTRYYPDGTNRTATVPAPKYKAMLRSAMPAAKQQNDTSEFLAVEYKQVGEKVRIETMRFTSVKKEASPLALVVGAGPDGKWMILEEYSESRPERKWE